MERNADVREWSILGLVMPVTDAEPVQGNVDANDEKWLAAARRAAANGSEMALEEAFSEWFTRNHHKVHGLVKQMLNGQGDCPGTEQDVTSIVMAKVWKRSHTFKGGSRFFTWVTAIAKRECINSLRAVSKLPLAVDVDVLEACIDDARCTDPRGVLITKEEKLALERAMRQLNRRERLVVEEFLAGFSEGEVAERLNLRINQVNGLKKRALDKLRLLKGNDL